MERATTLRSAWDEYFRADPAGSAAPPAAPPLATGVALGDDMLTLDLSDGRVLAVPLVWYPRLWDGAPEERGSRRLIGGGEGVHWPDLAEHVSVEWLLAGRRSSESQRSLARWLTGRGRRGAASRCGALDEASHRSSPTLGSSPAASQPNLGVRQLPIRGDMQGTVAITDYGWYDFLRRQGDLREVNFWTPSSRRAFRSEPFAPLLFKLKAPHNAICGFGYFAQYTRLPDWLAWECFGIGNGAATLAEMRSRIQAIRERIGYEEAGGQGDIGCILLVSPVFFPPGAWVPQPADWPTRSLTPVRYDLAQGEGLRVWAACQERAADYAPAPAGAAVAEASPRYGQPRLVEPRLGQGTFRVAVLDAYGRACAVTGEHSLPALDAAHIQPFAERGPHVVSNGLLLRADLHRLFDTGYVTVTPDRRFEVSPRLRADYRNGRSYYPLHGAEVRVPADTRARPDPEFLRYHNERIFLV